MMTWKILKCQVFIHNYCEKSESHRQRHIHIHACIYVCICTKHLNFLLSFLWDWVCAQFLVKSTVSLCQRLTCGELHIELFWRALQRLIFKTLRAVVDHMFAGCLIWTMTMVISRLYFWKANTRVFTSSISNTLNAAWVKQEQCPLKHTIKYAYIFIPACLHISPKKASKLIIMCSHFKCLYILWAVWMWVMVGVCMYMHLSWSKKHWRYSRARSVIRYFLLFHSKCGKLWCEKT